MSDRGQALRSGARYRPRDTAYEDTDFENDFEAPVYEDEVPEIVRRVLVDRISRILAIPPDELDDELG